MPDRRWKVRWHWTCTYHTVLKYPNYWNKRDTYELIIPAACFWRFFSVEFLVELDVTSTGLFNICAWVFFYFVVLWWVLLCNLVPRVLSLPPSRKYPGFGWSRGTQNPTRNLTRKSNAQLGGPHFGSKSPLYGAKLKSNAWGMLQVGGFGIDWYIRLASLPGGKFNGWVGVLGEGSGVSAF